MGLAWFVTVLKRLTTSGLKIGWQVPIPSGYDNPTKGKLTMNKLTYFTDDEVKGLDQELCAMLDRARGLSGVPFVITSGLRTQDVNDSLANSVKDSSHLTGNGVDLACEESGPRFNMLRGLILAGFKRIGIYEKHIHADNSLTLPQDVFWYVKGD